MKPLTTEQIKQVADEIECGQNCYWHKPTGELMFIPEGVENYDSDPGEGWEEELKKLENNPDDYVEIERMRSHESFQVMESFVGTLSSSSNIAQRLTYALGNKKPFQGFKYIIDNSGDARQMWFDFKTQAIKNWVHEKVDEVMNEYQEGEQEGD